MAGSSTASEILGRIENDAVFSGFLEPGFDPASFASKIVRADVGRAAAAAGAGAATAAAAVGATPVLQLQQGGDGLGSSSNGGGGVASAESVSSQAEMTLDVRHSTAVHPIRKPDLLFCLCTCGCGVCCRALAFRSRSRTRNFVHPTSEVAASGRVLCLLRTPVCPQTRRGWERMYIAPLHCVD